MGLEYWKSLEELAESPEVLERISQEFPGYDPKEITSLSRRRFMKLMSASMALAGLTLNGCRRWPKENIAPYSSNPRDRIAGIPEQYATVYEIGGVGHGVLATSYDGRPIKIEGNPNHPFATTSDGKLGAINAFHQASVLELYDPTRSRGPVDRSAGEGKASTWEDFDRIFGSTVSTLRSAGGRGMAVLSEISSSPSVAAMRQRFKQVYPNALWSEYEPLNSPSEREAGQLAFGRPVRTRLSLEKADCVVLFDADILGTHPAHIRYANDWSKRRRSADTKNGMVRMYMAESQLSITGAVADQRVGIKPSRFAALVTALAAKAGVAGVNAPEGLSAEETNFVESAAADLKRNGVVVGGPSLPAPVLALIHRINDSISAVGNTVALLDMPANDSSPLADLVTQIKSGAITTLIIIGGNPAYDAPADLGFAEALTGVQNSIHLSLYFNETSQASKWHLNKAHYLESWGDARAWDGTVSVQQPLILPLFGGKSTIEFLASLCGDEVNAGDAIVRRTFTELTKNTAENAFRRVLHDGVLPETAYGTLTTKPQAAAAPQIAAATEGYEIRFQVDHKTYDGRFSNNGWLQELPDSLTKLTWDNAALISKKDADALGVTNGGMLKLTVGDRSLEIAAFILPGQPLGVIGLPLGYGRTAAGPIGNGVGFNTYSLRTTANLSSAADVKVAATGGSYKLVATQEHHVMDRVGFEGRRDRIGEKNESGRVVHETTLAEFEKNPRAAHGATHHAVGLPLFEPPHEFRDRHAWGMAIDMTTCIGCNACVAACVAENNIPIVGKDQVAMNREMHWIRIDRYFKGEMDDPNPEIVFQPMTCVHCENAPCEQVCPVAATVHDTEGLNTMVYNRCIGTRYCSNNCPYKVRRFNYFDWHSKSENNLRGFPMPWLNIPDQQQTDTVDKIRRMVFNPEVTVRMRGVMEKCTYCVQRIHGVKTAKDVNGEALKDGDVVTACQQTCPTEAIVFGDLADPNSRVSKLHTNPRAYSVLEDLDTRPRTKHLALVRNPNESETHSAT